MSAKTKKIRVRLGRSVIGSTRRQRETVRALGLRRRGDVREIADTPATQGLIRAVGHLVEVVAPASEGKAAS